MPLLYIFKCQQFKRVYSKRYVNLQCSFFVYFVHTGLPLWKKLHNIFFSAMLTTFISRWTTKESRNFVLRRYTVLTYFEEEIKQGWNDGIHRYCIHHGFITVISYKAIGMIFILFAIFLFQGEFISNFATNFANMV